jgi:hypothetical protein
MKDADDGVQNIQRTASFACSGIISRASRKQAKVGRYIILGQVGGNRESAALGLVDRTPYPGIEDIWVCY